jgi:CubicO group peptidase (beta-lactamase class C family)
MKSIRSLLRAAIALLFCLAGPAGSTELDRADLEAWLDGFLPFALQQADIAGGVVVVVRDGEILFQKGYGYADVGRKIAMDPDNTLLRAGSVSKLFTWTAVMQLVEQGKLELDRDINEYLDFEIAPRAGEPVTLRHLMTHTPGFEDTIKNTLIDDPRRALPLEEFLKTQVPARIHPAGKVPAYSNYGVGLAGYIVERVAGESFDDYIEHNVFAPLGMTSSSFRIPLPAGLQARLAKGYALSSAPAKPDEMFVPAPAGNLATTAADMARFMIAHLQDGALGSARILKPETAALMHGTPLTIVPTLNRMMLGFYETSRNGRVIIGHGGDLQWFHTYLHLFMAEGVGLYVAVNSAGKAGAAGSIRTALFEQFADRYFSGPAPAGKMDASQAAEHARLMLGTYQGSRRVESSFMSAMYLFGQTGVVANPDGTITVPFLRGLDDQPKKWREIAPFVWRDVQGEDRLAAKVENGRVVMFSTDQVSPFLWFQRVPWWKSSAWLTPALVVSLLSMTATALLWPIAALTRRRYGTSLPLSGRDAWAYRGVRLASLAIVAVMGAWGATIASGMMNLASFTSQRDGWILSLQGLTFLTFVGGLLVALWHVRMTWARRAGWFGKVWSIVLGLAFVVMLWIAIVFNLMALSVEY